MRKNDSPNNLIQYSARAAKSLGHISWDVVKAENPAINSFVETNKDLFSEITNKGKKRR